jgi:hypothetical protein
MKPMSKYKIKRTYLVEAGSRIEARQIFNRAVTDNKEEEFLVQIDIQEYWDPYPNRDTSWKGLLKQQLKPAGNSNSKR